jgi:hypothetical protein
MNDPFDVLLNTDISFSNRSVEKGAAVAFREFLTENSIMLPQNGKPIFGIESIYNSMENPDSKEILSWIPQGGKVSQSQDLGYTWGFIL